MYTLAVILLLQIFLAKFRNIIVEVINSDGERLIPSF